VTAVVAPVLECGHAFDGAQQVAGLKLRLRGVDGGCVADGVAGLAIREPAVVPLAARAAFDWRFAGLPPTLKCYLAVVALFTLGRRC
jgi:hypothetical protein